MTLATTIEEFLRVDPYHHDPDRVVHLHGSADFAARQAVDEFSSEIGVQPVIWYDLLGSALLTRTNL